MELYGIMFYIFGKIKNITSIYPEEPGMEEKVKGKLMIIGGAEDKEGECIILRKLVELAGGREGSIVIMTVATEHSETIGREYTRIFEQLGVRKISVIHIDSRCHANHGEVINSIDNATCIFFTGGDQLRITSLLGGTKAEEKLKQAYYRGVVIAGTSAGASVMSETMIDRLVELYSTIDKGSAAFRHVVF